MSYLSYLDNRRAYDDAAKEYYKEFARLNFPGRRSEILSTKL